MERPKFNAAVASMTREQLERNLLDVAEAWHENDFEAIGVILEDSGLTEIDDGSEDDDDA
jgi:hypothetical protein